MNESLSESVDGLPNLCGAETLVEDSARTAGPVFLPGSTVDFPRVRGAFAVALHMHQPLIPAEGGDLRAAEVISNLRFMK